MCYSNNTIIYWDYLGEGWIKGNKCYKPNFRQNVSNANKDTIWIRTKNLTRQKHVKKDIAQELVESGNWEYGHLQYSAEQRSQQKRKSLQTKIVNGYVQTDNRRYPICLNCGKNNPNKFARCYSDECKKEYDIKCANARLLQKHLALVEKLKQTKVFRAQTTNRL